LSLLSDEHDIATWIAWATFFEGWVAGARGNEAEGIALMEKGLGGWRGAGIRVVEPYLLALLAEMCLRAGRIETAGERLAEARDLVEKTGECWWEAEVHRLEGELVLAAAGDGDRDDRAEASFRRALEVAARQGATSLELRAALSLSRLGRSPDAHQLLGEIVGRFTEGHDTADLRAAQSTTERERGANARRLIPNTPNLRWNARPSSRERDSRGTLNRVVAGSCLPCPRMTYRCPPTGHLSSNCNQVQGIPGLFTGDV
jgi:adenylate cyclase